jgi:ACS family sodium-dependent inorganic phosphate cotransporter
MALGGLISNRNFGSFIGSGNGCQRLGKSGAEVSKLFPNALLCRNHQPLQASLHHESGHMRRSFGCFLQPRMDSVIRFRNSIKINRSRAYYKSEESDITEGVVPSADGSAEAILVEGNLQNASPWWQQFPRRWVIVLLCFSSFLLCNMDRVNMSIAILPMSQEYNWSSATVGLIQSSFFWGYLLTQILGGIWADKFGGKVVLGFGVVWWSFATIMTPIAARLGLPFFCL